QIENNLDDPRNAPGGTCMRPADPSQQMIDWSDDNNVPKLAPLMMDMLAMAFSCDLTRVAVLQWNGSGGFHGGNSDRDHVSWIPGAAGGWHGLTHSVDQALMGMPAIKAIETWYYDQLASLVDRMASAPDGNGRLLDNMVIWTTNEHGIGTQDHPWS